MATRLAPITLAALFITTGADAADVFKDNLSFSSVSQQNFSGLVQSGKYFFGVNSDGIFKLNSSLSAYSLFRALQFSKQYTISGDSLGNIYGRSMHITDRGNIWRVTNGTYKYNKVFTNTDSGTVPQATIVRTTNGTLYGVYHGGYMNDVCLGFGAYSLTPNAKQTSWTFANVLDATGTNNEGCNPEGRLVVDSKNNIFGVAAEGGVYDSGTVYVLSSTSGKWKRKVLHTFTGGKDGAFPMAGVTLDADGNIYGTTSGGGKNGTGVVFKLTKASAGYKFSVLHTFTSVTSQAGNADGAIPLGGLVVTKAGKLYGTASGGGVIEMPGKCGYSVPGFTTELVSGCGVVFSLTPNATKTAYAFATVQKFMDGASISANPHGDLILTADQRRIIGTTTVGGNGHAGTVFSVTQ